MRQVVTYRHGPPDVLAVVDTPTPHAGSGQVVVQVAAAGVNYLDVYQRSGAYTVPLPFPLGVEGSGVVVEAGPDTPGFDVGDRVVWMGGRGAYATHCLVAADSLIKVPTAVALTDAAAVLVQGMTAHFLATDVVRLGVGDTCLVHAAAGGVGGLLTQLAVQRGATVVATVSTAAKAEAARQAGAAHVIDYSSGEFAQRVMDVTGGIGVDAVYDGQGGSIVEEGLRCLRPRGAFVLYGQTAGPVAPLDPRLLNARGSLFFTKPSLSHYDTTPDAVSRRAGEVLACVADGRLTPRVHGHYLLEGAAQAHTALETRATIGKLLLCPR
ncbi:quinone oxidoreductase [Winogradskya consettensis]|uniref:Alcohol dehydrogenase n=1 Tax=Winogradskya consettensis TaxID=113560 RepID=A0A919T1Q1_9ACTN|nr:quinone oxidoreductase [Actinoplanes consettensis]GIM82496.1 alcohol dehydrogenase [Actinoplanes consettensis]